MKQLSVMSVLGVATALFMLSGCTGKINNSGNGGNTGDTGDCKIDDSSDPTMKLDPNWEITSGKDSPQNYICPPNDVDYFWFTADAKTILSVHLRNNVVTSQLDLCYSIIAPATSSDAGKEKGQCSGDPQGHQIDLKSAYYLDVAGTYFIKVYASNAKEDRRNPYIVTITLEADPDSNEPNDSQDKATPVTVGNTDVSVNGYISSLGDQDWFNIGQINDTSEMLKIELTTSKPTPVDLHYDLIFQDNTVVNSLGNLDGSIVATQLDDMLPLLNAGTYYIKITDTLDDDSDTTVPYTLKLQLVPDPDKNEQNNSPADADKKPLNNEAINVSGAYIAYRGDQDWYRINTSRTPTFSKPALLQVDVYFQSGTLLNPAVDLVVADPHTPCNSGDDCKSLNYQCGDGCLEGETECRNAQCSSHECIASTYSCNLSTGTCDYPAKESCTNSTSCQNLGSGWVCTNTYCSKHCSSDSDCPANYCRGAGVCLPLSTDVGTKYGCGVTSLTMQYSTDPLQSWAVDKSDPKHLHTVAPMFGQVYYILVYDLSNINNPVSYDDDHSYNINASVFDDTHDQNEMNSLYLPYINNTQESQSRELNAPFATPIYCTQDQTPGSPTLYNFNCPGPTTGALSFRADQDWYVLRFGNASSSTDAPPVVNEMPSQVGSDTKMDWGLEITWSTVAGNNLNYQFEVFPSNRLSNGQDPWHRFSTPVNGTFGEPGRCGFICGESMDPYGWPLYIRLHHSDYTQYDPNSSYTFAINATFGCPSNCGKCKAGCNNYACPNHANTTPLTDGSGDCTDGPFN